MTGGVRFLCILAGIAALLCTFAVGFSAGTILNYPEEQRYQPYRYAADKPLQLDSAAPQVGQPLEYRSPCRDPKDSSESELCAEWKTANATKDSATWAERAVYVSIATVIGLLWTLYYTRRAVEEAAEATDEMRSANEISERIGKASVRAYISVTEAYLIVRSGRPTFTFVATNSGNSAARNVNIVSAILIHTMVRDQGTREVHHFPGPLSTSATEQWTVRIDENDAAALAALGEMMANGGWLQFYGGIKYLDAFDEWQLERFEWIFSGIQEGERVRGSPPPTLGPDSRDTQQ